jgi:hypothetical protein
MNKPTCLSDMYVYQGDKCRSGAGCQHLPPCFYEWSLKHTSIYIIQLTERRQSNKESIRRTIHFSRLVIAIGHRTVHQNRSTKLNVKALTNRDLQRQLFQLRLRSYIWKMSDTLICFSQGGKCWMLESSSFPLFNLLFRISIRFCSLECIF